MSKGNFDFETVHSRKHTAASKWNKMYASKPNVDEGIVPMSVADMDLIHCDKITEGLSKYIKDEILGYSQVTDNYIESVINFFERQHGYKAEKEWLVTTPGIVPALFTAVRAYSDENDGVIIMPPIYGPFFTSIENQNRRIESCPLINNGEAYEIDFDNLEKIAKKDDVKLLLFCSPHNPGSRVWKKEELEKIAKIAIENDLIIVSDEIHSDFALPGHKHIVFSDAYDGIDERTVICTAASKTYNIAGLQCSNIFIKNKELREKFIKANEIAGIERANVLGMKATQIAYDECDDWLVAVKDLTNKHHKIVEEFFKKYEPSLKLMKAESTFLAWVDFSGLNIKDEDFMNFLFDYDFFVNEGSMFGKEGEHFIRINLGLPTHKLEENLNRLEKGLKEKFNI